MGGIRFHTLIALLSYTKTSKGFGETIIVIAFELNLATIAMNLPAIRTLWVKTRATQTDLLDTTRNKRTSLRTGRITATHEISQISSPILREQRLSGRKDSPFDSPPVSGPIAMATGGTPVGSPGA